MGSCIRRYRNPPATTGRCLAIMGRTMTRLSYLRKMAWLMPRLQRAVPYLGYILVVGEKPASVQA